MLWNTRDTQLKQELNISQSRRSPPDHRLLDIGRMPLSERVKAVLKTPWGELQPLVAETMAFVKRTLAGIWISGQVFSSDSDISSS